MKWNIGVEWSRVMEWHFGVSFFEWNKVRYFFFGGGGGCFLSLQMF